MQYSTSALLETQGAYSRHADAPLTPRKTGSNRQILQSG